MGGRLGLGIATALSLLSAGGLFAQGTAPAPGPVTSPAYFAPAGAPASYGQALSGPPPVVQGAGPFGTYPQPSVAQAGYQSPDPNMSAGGPGCPSAYDGMPGCGNGDSPDNFVETPLEEILCRVLRNVEVRIDYINWGISKPATTLIGENPGPGVLQPFFNEFGAVQTNPTDVFPVFNNQDIQVGQARAYDTGGISLSENSGFQATFSLPMTYGTIETSGFILEKAGSAPNPGGLPAGIPGETQSFAAIPVTVGGQPSQDVAFFSAGFNQSFTSFVYGAESNIYFNAIVAKDYGFVIKPMIGFRYLGIDEHFDVVASNPGVPNSTVSSSTINNIYGPTVGGRFALLTKWFEIGLDPRVTFAVNQFAANVNASDPTVGDSHDHDIEARFAPVGQLDAFIKIPIQEHFRLYAAYNLIGVANVSRPQSQVDYDITTTGQNDTHLSLSSAGIMIQGYSVGCEFNF